MMMQQLFITKYMLYETSQRFRCLKFNLRYFSSYFDLFEAQLVPQNCGLHADTHAHTKKASEQAFFLAFPVTITNGTLAFESSNTASWVSEIAQGLSHPKVLYGLNKLDAQQAPLKSLLHVSIAMNI